jgi:hypothetical protein
MTILALRLHSRNEREHSDKAAPKSPKGKAMLFADALEECRRNRKTGLLNVSVVKSTKFLVRVYFNEGTICRLSYGPLHGKECLEFLEYYDFGEAVYLDGMKAPQDACAALPTADIIAAIKGTGKMIRVKQWLERR